MESFYFDPFDPTSESGEWLSSWVRGPLLDLGAGAGRHALVFQDRVATVATDVSETLVELMHDRGVRDARVVDMFSLSPTFDRDQFGTVLVIGTQAGLVGSLQGLRGWLGDLARVTDADATAVVDSYDPTHDAVDDLLGYRADPTPGLAHRVFHFAYAGEVSETLLFRLFSPNRLREATVGTGWMLDEVRRSDAKTAYYRAALTKA